MPEAPKPWTLTGFNIHDDRDSLIIPASPISYVHSLRLQEAVLEKHFAYKTLLRNSEHPIQPSDPRHPRPTLLTFQTHPSYTVGRRHLTANPLSAEQISFLTGASPHPENTTTHNETSLATFFPSPRGGLLTYHAPGQLTAYLILNLRTHNLTPRCYIRLLENTVIRTCARHNVPNVMTTEDPGVWIAKKNSNTAHNTSTRSAESCVAGDPGTDPDMTPTNRKICAIGVHVSRGITSHGIGLNVFDSPIKGTSSETQLYTLPRQNVYTGGLGGGHDGVLEDGTIAAPGYLSWGFSRIVACGLEGKSVTWLSREQELNKSDASVLDEGGSPVDKISVDAVAQSLALEVAKSLEIDGDVEVIGEDSILQDA